MLGETSSKNPRISHVSISTGDICSEFGSSSDFANYTVHVPPTPDNNPAPLHIALQDIDTGSSYKDDDLDQTELRISEEEDALLYKVSQPLTRVVKISPIIIALYRYTLISLSLRYFTVVSVTNTLRCDVLCCVIKSVIL